MFIEEISSSLCKWHVVGQQMLCLLRRSAASSPTCVQSLYFSRNNDGSSQLRIRPSPVVYVLFVIY
jgi:hypothetical protein